MTTFAIPLNPYYLSPKPNPTPPSSNRASRALFALSPTKHKCTHCLNYILTANRQICRASAQMLHSVLSAVLTWLACWRLLSQGESVGNVSVCVLKDEISSFFDMPGMGGVCPCPFLYMFQWSQCATTRVLVVDLERLEVCVGFCEFAFGPL